MMGKSIEVPDEKNKAVPEKPVIDRSVSSLWKANIGRSFSRVEEEETGRSVAVVG
jgi:hypothetical protein